METKNNQNQEQKPQATSSKENGSAPMNQTPAQKKNEENLTEKDVNPSKEEKKIVQEHGKGEQQTSNISNQSGASKTSGSKDEQADNANAGQTGTSKSGATSESAQGKQQQGQSNSAASKIGSSMNSSKGE